MFETKNVKKLKYSQLKTGFDLCLQRLSGKFAKKTFQKNDEAKKPEYVFENKYF